MTYLVMKDSKGKKKRTTLQDTKYAYQTFAYSDINLSTTKFKVF